MPDSKIEPATFRHTLDNIISLQDVMQDKYASVCANVMLVHDGLKYALYNEFL